MAGETFIIIIPGIANNNCVLVITRVDHEKSIVLLRNIVCLFSF